MATYYYNVIQDKAVHNNHFIQGKYYRSKLQNITACYSGNPEKNIGYWGSPKFPDDHIRMITPKEWELIEQSN